MERQVLHIMWCDISGEAAGEIWNWSLLWVKGLKVTDAIHFVKTALVFFVPILLDQWWRIPSRFEVALCLARAKSRESRVWLSFRCQATGSRLASVVTSISTAIACATFALYYGWKLTLLVFAFLPFLILASGLRMKGYTGGSNKKDDLLESGAVSGPSVGPIWRWDRPWAFRGGWTVRGAYTKVGRRTTCSSLARWVSCICETVRGAYMNVGPSVGLPEGVTGRWGIFETANRTLFGPLPCFRSLSRR